MRKENRKILSPLLSFLTNTASSQEDCQALRDILAKQRKLSHI